MGLIKLIAAVIIGGFVILAGGCFAIVGGVTHVANDVAKGEKLDNNDIYFVSQPQAAERKFIANRCQTAFATGQALKGFVRANARSNQASANVFCGCLLDKAGDVSVFDRQFMLATFDESIIRLAKLNVGLEKAGLDPTAVKARSAEAKHRNANIIRRCAAELDSK